MRTYGVAYIQVHSFLTPTLDGDDGSSSPMAKEPPVFTYIKILGPKASQDNVPLPSDELRLPDLPVGIRVTELPRLLTYVCFNVRFAHYHNGTALLPLTDAEDSEHT
jgi:hypothetical protein